MTLKWRLKMLYEGICEVSYNLAESAAMKILEFAEMLDWRRKSRA